MKICKTCVLTETFPGIQYDNEGRCNYCRRYKGRENQEQQKERFKQKFLTILDKTRNTGSYEVLMAYSGGKDSTYTLKLLKENYELKVLAITFDHGERLVEAILLDFDNDIYGQDIRLDFYQHLRRQRRFPSPQELADQIRTDCRIVQQLVADGRIDLPVEPTT